MQQAARVVSSRRAVEAERDAFFVSLGGFDAHTNLFSTLDERLGWLDTALGAFADEMTAQGVWSHTAVLVVSEFGRTMSSNGQGSDHGWAGNAILLGGGVDGGKIHGKYPTSLADGSQDSAGRGRLIPTTSWEAVWYGLAQWFGVDDAARLQQVLPNLGNFRPADLLRQEVLFR